MLAEKNCSVEVVGDFFPLKIIPAVTCNDTHIFKNVLVEGGLVYTEV